MISAIEIRKLALELPDATEQPHFEKTSFRVKKKIFLTLDEKNNTAVAKLSEADQSIFCETNKTVIYPVPGAWGKRGWTIIEIKKVKKIVFRAMLMASFDQVTMKKR